jgi:hypothetical protein
MPKIAKHVLERMARERQMIEQLEKIAFSEGRGVEARSRALSTLNNIHKRHEKAEAEKQAAAKERKQDRDEAERTAILPRLPDNGRAGFWAEREAERRR